MKIGQGYYVFKYVLIIVTECLINSCLRYDSLIVTALVYYILIFSVSVKIYMALWLFVLIVSIHHLVVHRTQSLCYYVLLTECQLGGECHTEQM